MAQVTLKGNPVQVKGNLPQAGAQAPAFSLVGEGGTLDCDHSRNTRTLWERACPR